MSEWWWIVLAAFAVIVALEFVVMRRSDAVWDGGGVIDSAGDDPSDREPAWPGGMIDEGRAQERHRPARNRTRRMPELPPWGE